MSRVNKFDFVGRYAADIGNTFKYQINYTDQDGEAIDLTGFTLEGAIKRRDSDTSDLISLPEVPDETSTGFYIADKATGIIVLRIIASDTAAVVEDRYVYDIVLTEPSGESFIFMSGKIEFNKGVTK